jgi:hypothetical protein
MAYGMIGRIENPSRCSSAKMAVTRDAESLCLVYEEEDRGFSCTPDALKDSMATAWYKVSMVALKRHVSR